MYYFSSSEQLRKQTQSENLGDLRETLEQNRSLQRSTSHEDGFGRQFTVTSETTNRQWRQGKPKESQNRQRQKYKKPGDRKHQGKKSIQELEELARAKQLFEVVSTYTIKQGVIPQKKAQPEVSDQLDSINDFGQPNAMVTPEELKRRPSVPGGRGFFEDITMTNVNGHFNESSESWSKKKAFKNKGIATEGFVNDQDSHCNETKSYKTLKRRSTEENSSQGSVSEPTVPKRIKPYHQKRPKQLFCNTQMRLGKCDFKFCKFKHLTESELEEVLNVIY